MECVCAPGGPEECHVCCIKDAKCTSINNHRDMVLGGYIVIKFIHSVLLSVFRLSVVVVVVPS